MNFKKLLTAKLPRRFRFSTFEYLNILFCFRAKCSAFSSAVSILDVSTSSGPTLCPIISGSLHILMIQHVLKNCRINDEAYLGNYEWKFRFCKIKGCFPRMQHELILS